MSKKESLVLESNTPGNIKISQTITLDSGDYFILAKYLVTLKKGTFFIQSSTNKSINITSSESTCLRTVLTLPIKGKTDVDISFGFSKNSVGSARIDTLMVYKVDYKVEPNKTKHGRLDLIDDNLSLNLNLTNNLDEDIDHLASSINKAFLSKSLPEISTYSSELFKNESTSYLANYVNDEDVRNSYCQKSSLSLDELLRLYNIPTRQLHWQKNCNGFHQFLEYWNPTDQKWKIIDPYYGIRYIDSAGNYLGFEEIERLVRNNSFTRDNIKEIDIGHLYYSESEIIAGWLEADLAVHVINK